MEKVLGDLLTCPICLEIPTVEIYQCKNGHSICLSCSARVSTCPQCKVSYGVEMVRNRALEDLIGSMQISCKHKSEGCDVSVMRKDVQAHEDSCKFRPFLFCQKIPRFEACNFGSATGSEIFDHIAAVHKCGVWRNATAVNDMQSAHLVYWRRTQRSMGYGALNQLKSSNGQQALYFTWSYGNLASGDFTMICLYFAEKSTDISPFLVRFELDAPRKDVNWSWTGSPPHFSKVDASLASPPLRVLMKDILELHDDEHDSSIKYKTTFYEK